MGWDHTLFGSPLCLSSLTTLPSVPTTTSLTMAFTFFSKGFCCDERSPRGLAGTPATATSFLEAFLSQLGCSPPHIT